MKTFIKILLVIGFNINLMHGQDMCQNTGCTFTDTLDISTGYDPATNAFIAVGANDPLYRLANLPPLNGTNYNNPIYGSVNIGQMWSINPHSNSPVWNVTGASIISPRNVSTFQNDNAFPNQPFRIVREFCVCDATQANINLNIKGDDSARITIYDQTNTPVYTFNICQDLAMPHTFPHTNNTGSSPHFNGNHFDNRLINLNPGTHTIELEVQNSNQGAMGVSLNGSITAVNTANVLSHPQNCCPRGTIYAQKIIDNNCDGIFNFDDQPQSNITFNLIDTSTNTIVTSEVTDVNGEVFFRNIPYGAYSVQEIVPNSFVPFSTTSQNVTLNPNNASSYLTFFNCIKELRIRKVIDENCNGIFDNNEQLGGAGWTFDVLSGNTIVGTTTTSANGLATIAGLSTGNYTIRERINSASTFNQPFQNNVNINYNDAINNPTIDIFNCEPLLIIRKVLDNNCNGTLDATDQIGGAGWTFDIMNGNTIVSSASTDASGVARFPGLVSGNYTINERLQGASSHPNPFQNNVALNYNPTILNQSIDFYNCLPPPFPACCENPLTIERTNQGDLASVPSGIYNSDPFSMVQDEFTILNNSAIPITEFRAVVTDIDFDYNFESCAQCVDNPALWGSIGGSLYVGNKLIKEEGNNNILRDRINRREIIWKEKNGAMLTSGDTFNLDYALPALSDIPCCVTSVEVCIELSYKDANCVVCTENICRTIDLSVTQPTVNALAIDVTKEGCCNRKLTANADTNANYTWSTGATSKSIIVSKNGTYTVTATSGGSSITETIVVNDIMSGDFPLLSFNSLFHPDNTDPYWEPKCFCNSTFLGICVDWSGCWRPGQFKNKFYIMDVSPGKVVQGVPNSYNANEYKLEIYHRWNTAGGQGQPLKTITGTSSSCNGFNNWDIFWDGTDDNGQTLKDDRADAYVWRLTLKNCSKESSRMTYKTTFDPKCGDCVKWRKVFWWRKCVEYEGCWNTETFEFGDVEYTK